MSKSLSIMQPTYLPYLGYFVLMAASDAFYLLDDVQFARQTWQQRNRLLGPEGEQRLTIEVQKQPLTTPICDILINDQKPWREKHLLAVETTYHSHPHFNEGFDYFNSHITAPQSHLADLTCGLIIDGARRLGINTPISRTHRLNAAQGRSDRLVSLCDHAKASDYLSPIGAKAYLEADGVLAKHVTIHYMQYHPTPYPQKDQAEFVPYLGFLDAVMSLGFEATGEMIKAAIKSSFEDRF